MQQGLPETIYRNYETAHIPCLWRRSGFVGASIAYNVLASKRLTNLDIRSFSPVAAKQRDDCAQKMHFPLRAAGIVRRFRVVI